MVMVVVMVVVVVVVVLMVVVAVTRNGSLVKPQPVVRCCLNAVSRLGASPDIGLGGA